MSNFWQTVVKLIGDFWNATVQGFTDIARFLYNLQRLHAWGMIIFLGLLWYAVTYVYDAVNWIGERIGPFMVSLASGGAGVVGSGTQQPSALETAFSVVNAFLPVTEFFGFMAFIMPIWMIAVTIRVVKAWIPTVS